MEPRGPPKGTRTPRPGLLRGEPGRPGGAPGVGMEPRVPQKVTRTSGRGLLRGEPERREVEEPDLAALDGDDVPDDERPYGARHRLPAGPDHLADRGVGQPAGYSGPRVASLLAGQLEQRSEEHTSELQS